MFKGNIDDLVQKLRDAKHDAAEATNRVRCAKCQLVDMLPAVITDAGVEELRTLLCVLPVLIRDKIFLQKG